MLALEVKVRKKYNFIFFSKRLFFNLFEKDDKRGDIMPKIFYDTEYIDNSVFNKLNNAKVDLNSAYTILNKSSVPSDFRYKGDLNNYKVKIDKVRDKLGNFNEWLKKYKTNLDSQLSNISNKINKIDDYRVESYDYSDVLSYSTNNGNQNFSTTSISAVDKSTNVVSNINTTDKKIDVFSNQKISKLDDILDNSFANINSVDVDVDYQQNIIIDSVDKGVNYDTSDFSLLNNSNRVLNELNNDSLVSSVVSYNDKDVSINTNLINEGTSDVDFDVSNAKVDYNQSFKIESDDKNVDYNVSDFSLYNESSNVLNDLNDDSSINSSINYNGSNVGINVNKIDEGNSNINLNQVSTANISSNFNIQDNNNGVIVNTATSGVDVSSINVVSNDREFNFNVKGTEVNVDSSSQLGNFNDSEVKINTISNAPDIQGDLNFNLKEGKQFSFDVNSINLVEHSINGDKNIN